MIKLTALRASLTFPQKENLQNAESLRHFLLPRQALKLNLLTIQGPTETAIIITIIIIIIIIIIIKTIDLTWGKNEAPTRRGSCFNGTTQASEVFSWHAL